MKAIFKVKRVAPQVYLLDFKSSYLLAMHFVRYQERYESSNRKYRNRSFKLLEFMEWYQVRHDRDCFTYPQDWGGFNVPSHVFREQFTEGIPDPNHYDETMREVIRKIQEEAGERFYVIGTVGSKDSTFKHELSHGFFYTSDDYRSKMTALVEALPPNLRKSLEKHLLSIGYNRQVLVDEVQAYMATGLPGDLNTRLAKALAKHRKPFQNLFRKLARAHEVSLQ